MSEPSPVPLMVAPFQLASLQEASEAIPPPEAAPPPTTRRRGGAPSHRRRRSRTVLVLLAVVLLVLAAAGVFVRVRLSKPDPAPVVTSVLRPAAGVAAAAVSLPWPATGQGAVSIPSIGVDIGSPGEQAVPVASLTKLMTAYVVLHDHPLAPGEAGPNITVTADDVADYNHDTVSDDSNALVSVGEVLTEHQVLAGTLVHSADNYADLLARWDAGSVPAFVAKMNAASVQLGMTQSHWADPSGISAGSQSTAMDILKVAALDMDSAVVRSIVRMPDVTLPEAGTIRTYTPLLGLQGILGVKSGFTQAAGGCDVLGVVRSFHGRSVLLLAAVTGQTGPGVLATAGLHGLALVNAVGPVIGSTPVVQSGQLVAHVRAAGHTVDAATSSSVSVLTWPGVTPIRTFQPYRHLTDQARRGARIGTVVVTMGTQHFVVPVRLQKDVPRLTLMQRLF